MSNEQQLHDSDDETSDEEYVPGGEDLAQLSEEEGDGDPEDDVNSDNETSSKKQKKRKGKTKRRNSKKQKIEEVVEDEPEEEKSELTEEEQKKKTDSLWADFLKDADFKPKPKTNTVPETKVTQPVKKIEEKKVEKKIEVEKEKEKKPIFFEFAGEKIDSEGNVIEKKELKPQAPSISRKSGGLGSILNQIGKKQKISTLEKSKLDWDKFKKDEDIIDELKSHNMGKNGYLDRQDFLQRTDLRQFEMEKEARGIKRTHRS